MRSTGRNAAKSFRFRASTQTGFASAAERDISARSSDGTLLAFSQSRAATRMRLASNESYSCCSPQSAQVVDQLADLGRGELLVGDAADRRQLLGPEGRPAGRHHHVLVPAEQRTRLRQIRDLGEALPQFVELRLTHERETYMRRASAARLAGRRESSEDDPSLRLPGIER